MPPLALANLFQGPNYDMGDAGLDLLITSRAPIGLRARLPGQMPHPEVALDILVPRRPLVGPWGVIAALVLPGHTTSLRITLSDALPTSSLATRA